MIDTLYLHAGQHKTGSTAIQQWLAARAQESALALFTNRGDAIAQGLGGFGLALSPQAGPEEVAEYIERYATRDL